jgi:oligopeptide/dipeptide ABC transporter ATP-binding protein
VREAAILKVDHLVAAFDTENGRLRAVDDVSFELSRGRILGLVGESGCGKSVTALSIMRLLPKPAGILEQGRVLYNGVDIAMLPAAKMHEIRGRHLSMIFQEPMTALNPVHKIGKQIAEVFALHRPDLSSDRIRKAALDMLNRVGIPEPLARMNEYPHQVSGGMRQRVMIGMALAGKPDILIADEPTTALDVTIQAQILDLILDLQRQNGMAVIFITHDLGVVAEICDDVVVMYAGKVVESASVQEIFQNPGHPYTQGLLASILGLKTRPKSQLQVIAGTVPSLADLPAGCRFQNRCPYVMAICIASPPELYPVGPEHLARCFLHAK